MEKISFDGLSFDTYTIPTTNSAVLIIKGGKGFLGCRYFNLEVAERLGDAVAVVSAKNIDAMLEAEVLGVSPKAAELGITPGMSGKDALKRMV